MLIILNINYYSPTINEQYPTKMRATAAAATKVPNRPATLGGELPPPQHTQPLLGGQAWRRQAAVFGVSPRSWRPCAASAGSARSHDQP